MSEPSAESGGGPERRPIRGFEVERTQLLLLAIANFVVGFGAFSVIGIVPPIARGLAISEAAAGQVMTAYAIGYAIGSPLCVALTGTLRRRSVLSFGLLLFGIGGALSAMVPSLEWLLAARIAMALGGGLVTPVAASVAIGLVHPNEQGRALAVIFGGLTVAQAIGVPAGAWMGYVFGWRATFAASAVMAVLAAVLIFKRIPTGLNLSATGLRQLGQVLAQPALITAVGFTALFIGGQYFVFTYLAGLLEERFGIGRDGVTLFLVIYGFGAVLGNILGGRLTDRIGTARTLALICASQIVILPLLTAFTVDIVLTTALTFVWSMTSWGFMVPQQARLAALRPEKATVLLALNASCLYIGASAGSALGGLILAGSGYSWLGTGGAVALFLALVSIPLAARLDRSAERA